MSDTSRSGPAATADHRIGIIKPTRRTRADYWRANLPESVEIEVRYLDFQRGDLATFEAAFPQSEHLATGLRADGCELVVVPGGRDGAGLRPQRDADTEPA